MTLKTGIKSLRCLEREETFHPVVGPSIEAKILHVDQQKLSERARVCKKFVIWDIGFGAAANALAAVEALVGIDTETEIHSFDRTTAAIEFAIGHAPDLDYLNLHLETIRSLLHKRKISITPHLTWFLHLEDFAKSLERPELPSPHALIYDPYSPAENVEMWTLEHFRRLYRRLDPKVPCLLTNYTRSTAVRATLLMAGFFVGRGCAIGEKAETTIASNRIELLDKPLGSHWLQTVQASSNSAPLKNPYALASISAAELAQLKMAPQFN